jgi:hypothetical protein
VSGDAQCPSDAITRRLDTAYRRLHRRLAFEFPSLYEAVSANQTITGDSLTKPADFEAVRLIQKQYGDSWVSLGALPSLNREDSLEQAFYELGSVFKVTPASTAPGTYRIFYTVAPVDGYITYDLPPGLEDIIVAEVAAWASERHEERERTKDLRDEAKRIWDEAYMPLWNRFGSHSNSGMNISR